MNRRMYAVVALMILLIVPASLVLSEKTDETSLEMQAPVFGFQTENPEYFIEGSFEYGLENGTLSITYYYGNDSEVTIPSEVRGYPVTSISYYAFEFNSSIESIYIPDSVIYIDEFAFLGSSIEYIVVDGKNAYYSSIDGVLFDKEKETLIAFPSGKSESYAIPTGVKRIGNYAFFGCESLETVTIPSSVNSIGSGAFASCVSLISVDIPYGVSYIDSFTFFDCINLESVVLPESVTSIFWGAFYDCVSLKSITIPSSVYYVDLCAFEGCGLTSIYIRNTNTYFGESSLNLFSEQCTIFTDDIYFSFDEYVKGDSSVVFTNEFECTILFVVNDEVISEQIFHETGGSVIVPGNPVKEGHKFMGWDPEVGPVKRNTTYVAQFERSDSTVLKEFAEGLYNAAQTFNPYFIDNEGDYEIWEGTKIIDKTVTVSKDLVFKDGLVLKFKNDGKIVIPIGLDLIINGTVEFENAGSKIQIEFINNIERTEYHSAIYAGQIYFTSIYREPNDVTSSVVMTCDNSFTLGLRMQNTFGDNTGDSFILDYELYIDIHGTEDIELKTVTSYDTDRKEYGETKVRNNPDGREVYLRINGNVSALYEFATGLENESWIEILGELFSQIDNNSMVAPNLTIEVEIYDIIKNQIYNYDNGTNYSSNYSSEMIFEGIDLSFVSDSMANTVEFSLNIINFKLQEEGGYENFWSSSFIDGEFLYRGVDKYDNITTIDLNDVSLNVIISSGDCEVTFDAGEIYVKNSSKVCEFYHGDIQRYFSCTETRVSGIHFEINIKTTEFKNFILNFVNEINKGDAAGFSAFMNGVTDFDIIFSLDIDNVELTGPIYEFTTYYTGTEYITPEEFIEIFGDANYENANAILCSDILFFFEQENGTVHIVFSVDTVEGEGITVSNFFFEAVSDVSYADDLAGTLFGIISGDIDSDVILALFDSLEASSGESMSLSVDSIKIRNENNGLVFEMEIDNLLVEESLTSDEIMFSMKFDGFLYRISFVDDGSIISEVIASNVSLLASTAESGMKSELSNFLALIGTENPDIEKFIEEIDLSFILNEKLNIGSLTLTNYEVVLISVKNLSHSISTNTKGSSSMKVTADSIEHPWVEIYGLSIELNSTYEDLVKRNAYYYYRILTGSESMDNPDFLRDLYDIMLSDTSISLSVGFNRICIDNWNTTVLFGLKEGYDITPSGEERAFMISFGADVRETDDLIINVDVTFSLSMSDDAVVEYIDPYNHIFMKGLNLSCKVYNEKAINLWDLIISSNMKESIYDLLPNITAEAELEIDYISAYFEGSRFSIVVKDFAINSKTNLSDINEGLSLSKMFGDYEIKVGELSLLTGTVFDDSSGAPEGPAVGFMTVDGSEDYVYVSFRTVKLTFDDYNTLNVEAAEVTADMKSGSNVYSTIISEETLLLDNKFSVYIEERIVNICYTESMSGEELPTEGLLSYITVDITTVSADSDVLKGETYLSGSEILVEQFGTGTAFAGWNVNGIFYADGKYAKLTSQTATIREIYETQYTITYKDGDTVLRIDRYLSGSEIEEYSPSEGKVGHTFMGWDGTVPATMPAEDLIFNAVWKADRYTLTFDSDEGSIVASVTQDYGTAITVPNPTKTGYTFKGWSPALPATMPAEDMTIKAVWEINRYTLTFEDYDGSLIAKITEGYGTPVTAPTVSPRTGYTFTGWDRTVPTMMTAENITIKAVWEIVQSTITFDTAGGSVVKSITQDYGTTVAIPADPTKIGHTFDGWDADIPATMPADDVTIKATWKINQYTITLVYGNGEANKTITQNYDTDISAEPNPSRTGYDFVKWDKDIPATMPAENMTIQATWKIKQYTITFDAAGGSAVKSITQDYGTTVAMPADPTKIGHTFDGWNADIPTTMPAEDLVFTATWIVNQYTMTFDSKGGTEVAPITQDYGSDLTVSDTEKDGHIFKGWSPSVPATIPAKDVTFTAVWYKVIVIADDSKETSVDSTEEDGIAIAGKDLEKLRSNVDESEKEEKYIDINLNKGSVSLPKGAIDVMVDSEDKEKSVMLSLETKIGIEDENVLEKLEEDMREKVATAFIVNINLSNVKSTKDLGDVKITVPYTLKEGENGDWVKVYFISTDGDIEEKDARYFEIDGTGYVEFVTTHFSNYAIFIEEPVLDDDYTSYRIAIAITLVIVAVAILMIKRSRRPESF